MSKRKRSGGLQTNRLIVLGLFGAGVLLFGLPRQASAFPEMIQHGYSNCISCHVAPYGGGNLTEYGRELSGEVLSTWTRKDEGKYSFGDAPKWIMLGGDLRTLNIRQEAANTSFADRLILMQADFELAMTQKGWTIDATLGRLDTAIYPNRNDWLSRRHFIMFKPAEEFEVRAGRFQVPFGINMPDHFAFTKEGLNWDQGTETYNIEGGWLNERYNLFVAGSFGRFDDKSLERDSGVDVTGSVMLNDKIKAGLSYHYGTNDLANRHVMGPWGIVGITPGVSLLAEVDFQRIFASSYADAQWGVADYLKLDFEPQQGLHLFGTQEALKTNFDNAQARKLRWSAGVQWFPRPHYEVEFSYQSQQDVSLDTGWRQILWLMLHFYP